LNDSEPLWQGITLLIERGRLKTVGYVLDELKRNDRACYDHLKRYRRTLVVPDAELFGRVGHIAFQFPEMARPRNRSNKADPWVVALGEVRRLIVVTDELDRKGKIPHACRALKVPCINLAACRRTLKSGQPWTG
jgi:hypothetical protein